MRMDLVREPTMSMGVTHDHSRSGSDCLLVASFVHDDGRSWRVVALVLSAIRIGKVVIVPCQRSCGRVGEERCHGSEWIREEYLLVRVPVGLILMCRKKARENLRILELRSWRTCGQTMDDDSTEERQRTSERLIALRGEATTNDGYLSTSSVSFEESRNCKPISRAPQTSRMLPITDDAIIHHGLTPPLSTADYHLAAVGSSSCRNSCYSIATST
jgi:hypothetical protein